VSLREAPGIKEGLNIEEERKEGGEEMQEKGSGRGRGKGTGERTSLSVHLSNVELFGKCTAAEGRREIHRSPLRPTLKEELRFLRESENG